MAEEIQEQQAGQGAEAPQDPPAEQRTFTQEEVNRLLGKERAKYKGFADFKRAAEELEALKQRDMTEAQKATARAEAAEKKVAEYEAAESRRSWVEKAAKETGVPADVLSAIEADSEESLMEKAESMKGYFAKPSAPVVGSDGHAANPPEAGESANDWLRSTIPGRRN